MRPDRRRRATCRVAEAALVAHERVRQPNEMRARASLDAMFRDRLPADKLERLLAEGALLSEDDACGLALSEPGVAIRERRPEQTQTPRA